MVGWVAELLRVAYDVWPSYGGAVVLVSLMAGTLCSPLFVKYARATQMVVALQSEIGTINQIHANGPTAHNAALRTLHKAQNVTRRTEWVLIAFLMVSVYVLAASVRGLTTLEPSNGGGPRYVEQGTALWRSLRDSGGRLSWFGIDLGASAFAHRADGIDVLAYLVLPIAFVVATAAMRRTFAGGGASTGVGLSLFLLALALFSSSAVVLYIVVFYAFETVVSRLALRQRRPSRTSEREFQAKCREADRLMSAGRADEAAAHRLNAIAAFVRTSILAQLTRQVPELQRNLVAAVAHRPSGAIAALDTLMAKCPECVTPQILSSVVAEWARSPRMIGFSEGWNTIQRIVERKSQDPYGVLLHACVGAGQSPLTEEFRRGVTGLLRDHLDTSLRLATLPPDRRRESALSGSAWQLLDRVGPQTLTRADQLCALGDLALARGSDQEALARHEVAASLGSTQAAQRLAYEQARTGQRLLVNGAIAGARQRFAAAMNLYEDPEYVLLDAIASILDTSVDSRIGLNKLNAVEKTGRHAAGVAFWRAIAHLQRDESDQAVALLRQLGRGDLRSANNQGRVLAEEGATLLAVLEGDDHALVDYARRLVRVHRKGWIHAGATDPLPMLAAVARQDSSLLAEMVALLPNVGELPAWARVAGAHALLVRSVELAREGLVGQASSDLETAERLLKL